MDQENVLNNMFDLYIKEREYQLSIFGDFTKNPSLNLSSFISFVETYLEKTRNAYAGKWASELPSWLVSCKEYAEQGSAPIAAYEYLIKVFALAGAALEVFTDIDPSKWREEGIKEKWINSIEHNPNKCKVCKIIGDYSITSNTERWLDLHNRSGFKLRIIDGKIFEQKNKTEVIQ